MIACHLATSLLYQLSTDAITLIYRSTSGYCTIFTDFQAMWGDSGQVVWRQYNRRQSVRPKLNTRLIYSVRYNPTLTY